MLTSPTHQTFTSPPRRRHAVLLKPHPPAHRPRPQRHHPLPARPSRSASRISLSSTPRSASSCPPWVSRMTKNESSSPGSHTPRRNIFLTISYGRLSRSLAVSQISLQGKSFSTLWTLCVVSPCATLTTCGHLSTTTNNPGREHRRGVDRMFVWAHSKEEPL